MKLRLHHFIFFSFFLIPSLSFQLVAQVIANFTYTATPASGCAPVSVNFTNTSTGAATYSWNFGNGNTSTLTSPGATYNNPGVYSVVLTASNGASSNTHTVSISAFANPVPSFTTSAMPSCVGQAVTFTSTSTAGSGNITTWDWDFGDGTSETTVTGSTTHAYVAAGTFPVTLIVTNSNGCSKNIISDVTVLAGPQADFTGTPSSSCAPPTNVDFTNTSTSVGAVTYLWNFGDGNTSTLEDPSNLYNFTGSFPVTLEIEQQGCRDTMTKNNFVIIQDIVPDFSADNTSACAGQVVTFTDMSVPPSVTRTWDFGDGSTSTLANPTHTYAAAGTYTVSLLNATAIGCTHSEIKNNYMTVFPRPVVSFSANQRSSCLTPFTVNFTDNSTNAATWLWDFGDGSTSPSQNPTHTYTDPGSYDVTLTVTSADGCQTTLIRNNYIFISDPVAGFSGTPLEGCIPLQVAFVDSSSSLADAIVNYSWDFGNGTASSAAPLINRTYAAVGTYTVRLIITTALGCKDTVTKVNYVKAGTPPTANFSVVDPVICHSEEAEFTDLSVGADSVHWEFDIDQGTFDTPFGATIPYNPVLQHFVDTGTFFVRQIAFSNGCPDTFQLDNVIRVVPPKAFYTYVLNCTNPNSVTFTDASQGADSIQWNFLDGTPLLSNVPNPTHVFSNVGPKGVVLTAWNFTTGCFENSTQVMTIADPDANFTANPNIGCYALPVNFTNLSIDEDTVTWNFGDGTFPSTDTTSFFHTYALPGTYTVTLTVTDVNGCIDSTKSTVEVYGPLPNFNANVLTGCAPLAVNFNDISVSDSTLVQWTWDFGDGSAPQTTASSTINHTYNVPGLYTVRMDVTDKNGCVKTLFRSDYIEPTFPSPVIVGDTFVCSKQGAFFDASGSGVAQPATFDWDFGDGTTGTGIFTTHFYTTDSLFTVNLTVTDKNNCVSSIQHQVRVENPVAAFTYSVISQGCGVSNIQFTDQSTGVSITGWQWDFGDGASSAQQHPIHVYTRPGLFPVTLIVSNIVGCLDTFLIDSLLVLGPVGTFSFNPGRGCVPLDVTFTAVSSNATNYNWDFGDGAIVNTANPVVQHTYTQVDTATPFLLLGNILPDGSFCQFPAPTAGDVVVTTKVVVNIDSVHNVLCNGDATGTIFTSVSGGEPPYTYAWTTNPVQSLGTATNVPVGSYTVTVTDVNFCITPADTAITEPAAVITTAGINDTVCPGQPAVLTATAAGGSGGYYYAWQPGGIINAGTLNITPTTDSVYTVIAYDLNDCPGTTVTTTAIVYKIPADSILMSSTSPICPGESSDISAQITGPTGAVTYAWNPNIGNGAGVYTVIPLVPTTYTVTITNACGAVTTDSVSVLFNPPPTIVATSDTNIICVPGPLQFNDNSITGNITDPIIAWNWNFGDGATSNLQNPSHVYSQAGVFSANVTVTTVGGCTNNNIAAPVVITGIAYPIANFSVNSMDIDLPYDVTTCRNQSFGATSYQWDFGDGFTSTASDPSHLYTSVGTFQIRLVAMSANGCSDTSYVQITTNADVVFPNAFTPNSKIAPGGAYDANNMDNDIFFPFTSGVVDYRFQIFNRWGELIFESLDVKIGWDGYYKGKLCQQDVYVWKAYVKHNNGREFRKTGDVTLLR